MTHEQQAEVDKFHEKVIALILKRSRVRKYGSWSEEEAINAEILKIEDARREYQRSCKPEKREKTEEAILDD